MILPWGMGFLPTAKNHVDRNASEAAAGVGLGDGAGVGEGTGLGDGTGVGVGVGRILLETEPQPANSIRKNPVKTIKAMLRKKTSYKSGLSRRGTYLIDRRTAAGRRLSWKAP